MKISVLLPTKNRLNLLKFAVESVVRQDYDDWEIIISDNFSEQDIEGYVRSLNDRRIRYLRTEKSLPVTDNWNNALSKATGDYVIMLGDDDCLLQGYFRTISHLVNHFSWPDCICSSALLFAYPGVMPGHPDGYLQSHGYASFMRGAKKPFFLSRGVAHGLVHDSMKLKLKFGFNMQFFTVRKGFIDSLREKGDFFQSPYPDYYASNVILLKAETFLVYPHPLVVIGISPKSFGFYYFNRLEKKGTEFLQNMPDSEMMKSVTRHALPGTDINTFWLLAMETVKENYGKEFRLKASYRRYRFLQILHVFRLRFLENALSPGEFRELWEKMSFMEKAVAAPLLRLGFAVLKNMPNSARKCIGDNIMKMIGQYPEYKPETTSKRYDDILAVFENTNPGEWS